MGGGGGGSGRNGKWMLNGVFVNHITWTPPRSAMALNNAHCNPVINFCAQSLVKTDQVVQIWMAGIK